MLRHMEKGRAENVSGSAVGALVEIETPEYKKATRSFTQRPTREASTLYLYPEEASMR